MSLLVIAARTVTRWASTNCVQHAAASPASTHARGSPRGDAVLPHGGAARRGAASPIAPPLTFDGRCALSYLSPSSPPLRQARGVRASIHITSSDRSSRALWSGAGHLPGAVHHGTRAGAYSALAARPRSIGPAARRPARVSVVVDLADRLGQASNPLLRRRRNHDRGVGIWRVEHSVILSSFPLCGVQRRCDLSAVALRGALCELPGCVGVPGQRLDEAAARTAIETPLEGH